MNPNQNVNPGQPQPQQPPQPQTIQPQTVQPQQPQQNQPQAAEPQQPQPQTVQPQPIRPPRPQPQQYSGGPPSLPQQPGQHSPSSVQGDYNSNPFTVAGKGLGAGLFKNPTTLLLLAALPFLVGIPLFLGNVLFTFIGLPALLLLALGILIIIVYLLFLFRLSAANVVLLLDSINQKEITTKEAVGKRSKVGYGSYLATVLLTGIAVLLGLILLVIPGIILAARLSLAPIIVYAEGLKAVAAMKRSMQLTKGHTLEMIGALCAQSILAGNGLISLAASQSGTTLRYQEISHLEKIGANKPKTHWLNYGLPLFIAGAFALYIIFVFFIFTSTSNQMNDFETTQNGSSQSSLFSGGPNARARDAKRQSDIRSLQTALEAYYTIEGSKSYPSESQVNSTAFRAEYFQGLDESVYQDPNADDDRLATSPTTNQYAYEATPNGCDGSATPCTGYTLTVTLEEEGVITRTNLQ